MSRHGPLVWRSRCAVAGRGAGCAALLRALALGSGVAGLAASGCWEDAEAPVLGREARRPPTAVAAAESAPLPAPAPPVAPPRVAWRFQSAAPCTGAPAVSESGSVYVSSVEGYVHALEADGQFRWSRAVSGTPLGTPAVDRNGQVFVATSDQRIYALRSDGRANWQHRSQSRLASAPVLGGAGVLYYAGRDARVYALSTWGGPLWSRALVDSVTVAPSSLTGGALAVGTSRPELWFLRNAGGAARLPLPAPLRQPVLSSPERVYAVAAAELLAVESSGVPRVEFRAEAQAAALSANAEWLVVQWQGQLRWVSPRTGQVLFAAELPGEASGAPAVTNSGVALVPMVAGDLMVLAPGQRQSARVGVGSAPVWPPIWDQRNQRVLVASSGVVAAIDLAGWPSRAPAATPEAPAKADVRAPTSAEVSPARGVAGEGT